ncbi:MAG: hypothetical protein KDA21_03970 [Phycisphaerales bacterium]|nr:hypothetical protein [Phycisphaerales bacterium]
MKSKALKIVVCLVALSGAAVMVALNFDAITGPTAGPLPGDSVDEANPPGDEVGDDGRRVVGSGFTPKHKF